MERIAALPMEGTARFTTGKAFDFEERTKQEPVYLDGMHNNRRQRKHRR
jgi:hypothetical protein